MADIQPTRRAGDTGLGIPGPVIVLVVVYWVVAALMVNGPYQDAYQQQAHRVDALVQSGLLTYNGRLDRSQIPRLSAEAEANRVCRAAHPKPADEPEPWYPPECGIYLPRDEIADVVAATNAAAHPDSASDAGWAAARGPLWHWAVVFAVLCAIGALVVWFVNRVDEPARPRGLP